MRRAGSRSGVPVVTTAVQVADEEAGIWTVPIPVRCETSGWLVVCNEDVIGSVDRAVDEGVFIGYDGFCPNAPRSSQWLAEPWATLAEAARAVAVTHVGNLFPGWMPSFDEDVEGELEDEDAYDAALAKYIQTGVYPSGYDPG